MSAGPRLGPLPLRLLGLGLGAVFVYASLDKIADPTAFARVVYRYQIVGPNALVGTLPANLVAVTLPWVELVAGLLLMTGVWRREAAAVVGALLAAFVAGVASTMWRGLDIENCGCFTEEALCEVSGLRANEVAGVLRQWLEVTDGTDTRLIPLVEPYVDEVDAARKVIRVDWQRDW